MKIKIVVKGNKTNWIRVNFCPYLVDDYSTKER